MKKHPKTKKSAKPVMKAKKETVPPVIKIAVIGAGPIGSILGAYLSRPPISGGTGKHQVTMVDVLKERIETIRKIGITVAGVVNFQTPVHGVTNKITELKNSNLDYIFICVKASALPAILRQVKSAMSKHTVVVSFQNGLDVEQDVAAALGKNRVMRAVINYAGNIMAEGQILMSFFNSPNYIGGLSAESNLLAEKTAKLLTDTGLTTKFSTEIKKYTWEKAVLNSALAPVCGLTHLKMNEAMALPQTRTLAQDILKEGIAVAKANGYDLGKKFYSEGLDYLNKTGAHKPSMLIDIEARNVTEIDYMNGKIMEYARAKNVPTPYNDTLTTLVRGLEKSFTTAEAVKKEKAAEAKAEEPASPPVRPGYAPPVKWGSGKPQGEMNQSSFNRGGSSYEMPAKNKNLSAPPTAQPKPETKKAHAKKAKTAKKKKALVRAR
ncbi:MAG: 2-dehydropantoate 2-reductase [Planctomycetes bacterium]|nr:2-dehydropantoate 2-reductase [Planctomycetota bacterium]